MSRLDLEMKDFERLQKALIDFSGDSEETINDVFHNDGVKLVGEEIQRLIPVSGRTWNGKKKAAKVSKSLTDEKGNLSFTVKTTKRYQYLYFPDDGTNTKNHAGNQQFFKKGGQAKQNEIIDRCIMRLTEGF